nr:spermidine/putrescine ABC transporter substrate-binding protein [Desulfuribacillus alkaliarsenatis]
MKKLAVYAFVLVLSIALTVGCSSSKDTLNIYSWADNFDPDVISEFEKRYDVRVNYDVFSSNEEMLAKLQAGAAQYDLIQPSDYMVEIMIELDMLAELNHNNIPNKDNIVVTLQKPPFDPESRYSIIYTWGVTGIAYNPNYVTGPITSWNDLWNDEYQGRVVLLNDPRETIGMALIKNGFSNSTQDLNELAIAVEDLKTLLPNVLAFDTDTIKQKFIAEEAWIGTVWSGDAAFIYEESENVEFVVPKEGATVWADTFAIPKGAKNQELAEKFINFIMEPEISAQNYEWIGYSNPNQAAHQYHSEEYLTNEMIFLPDSVLNVTEWLVDVGETLRDYDRYWTELRGGR